MSDHEGFEMLDETFGVREASEASDADSPHPKDSPHMWSPLQSSQPSSTPAYPVNDHIRRTGRVENKFYDGCLSQRALSTPSHTATSPGEEATRCEQGTKGKEAVLKITGEGRGSCGGAETLANSSVPEDSRGSSGGAEAANSSGDNGEDPQSSIIKSNMNFNSMPTTKPTSTETEGLNPLSKLAVHTSEARDIARASPAGKEKTEDAIGAGADRFLVAAPGLRLQQLASLGEGAGTSAARIETSTFPPPSEGGHVSIGTHAAERRASTFISAREGDEGSPLVQAPLSSEPPPYDASLAVPGTRSNSGLYRLGNLYTTDVAAEEVLFNRSRQQGPYIARTRASDASDTKSRHGSAPVVPALGFSDENRETDGHDSASLGAAMSCPPALAENGGAIMELVEMGFDRDHVIRALRECGRGESWKEAAISMLLEPQVSNVSRRSEARWEAGDGDAKSPLSSSERRDGAAGPRLGPPVASLLPCPICLCDIQAGEVFTVDCKEQHTFCVDCIHHHCSVQLLDSGLIPACPLSNMTCGHELSQEEVERVFLLKRYSSVSEGEKGGNTPATNEDSDRRALGTCRTLLTRRGLESTGAVPCVSPECGNWMVPEGSGRRVRCGSCLVEFCGRCKRTPYHYTANCDEVVTLGREWSAWLTEGKTTFLRAMAEQDSKHKALLDQHNRRKKEHDRAVEEAERLRLEYDRMEDWKELRCRCCPNCGRIIEKLSGCDFIVCGLDAHGGNVQNGCGVKFLWTRAKPYKGDRGERKTTPFTEKAPTAAARSRHFIAEGIPLRCDRCHRDVIGPLFRCVHCPSFACCLDCQDMACRDPHHVHHTFQVVDGEKENSPLMAAPAGGGNRGAGAT